MDDQCFSRLEIALKPGLFDAAGHDVKRKAEDYFGIKAGSIRAVRVLTVDSALEEEVKQAFKERVTDPVTEVSSFLPLVSQEDIDYVLWIGWKPSVKDNPGEVARRELLAAMGQQNIDGVKVCSSDYYAIKGDKLTREDIERIGNKIKANHIVQNFKVYSRKEWDGDMGIGAQIPEVILDHKPGFSAISLSQLTEEKIQAISIERKLFLNLNDIPPIRNYFIRPEVIELRRTFGLEGPTDVELEYTGQARSDHCNHNTFNGKFTYSYKDPVTGEIKTKVINNLFEEYIKGPTERLAAERPWVKSILWDNAGVASLGNGWCYVVTGETHNSPSNMEAYGGAITGIVGIYRDPMGTGLGSKLILGMYGFCVGEKDYDGYLQPELHPRRLLDGIIEGVKDGGNKSGIPTPFGNIQFEPESMGKSLVFVYAAGIMPEEVAGKPCYEKEIDPEDLIIMCGGRVGKDGIHGVTAASASRDENTPVGHVQIGDPYTQKKMHDFLLEARDEGLVKFITDNGGGGLSSSVGESSIFNYKANAKIRKDGAEVDLDKVPLKYEGLDPWEIWVSESQERMTVGIHPNSLEKFMGLSKKHDVESTVIGKFTGTGALQLKYNGETCAYLPSEFFKEDFPQWEFNAKWIEPKERGLYEPNIKPAKDQGALFKKMLSQPNIASKEWVSRQYDHEVQGGKVIGPLVGVEQDIDSDAVVFRPVLDSDIGLAVTQVLNPKYSKIDAYEMAASAIDEAVRNILVVGGSLKHLTGIDNFCYPSIEPGPENPDAEHKAAQLVRANMALKDLCEVYGIPLLSGKDSMYCDGELYDPKTGKAKKKVSGLETMQFTLHSKVDDINKCITCDAKEAGNLVYLIGKTKDESGGSEYYKMHGEVGLNVPRTGKEQAREYLRVYEKFVEARDKGCVASAKSVRAQGGLAINLWKMAAAGNLGMEVDVNRIPISIKLLDYLSETNDFERTIYSQSTGRIIVEVRETDKEQFESIMRGGYYSHIGRITANQQFIIKGFDRKAKVNETIYDCKEVWKSTHGGV